MELPFHLKALPPEALDVIRFFGKLDEPLARAEYIMEVVGLSDRTFGKVIRRLVTKGYIQMAGDQSYRLTDQGYEAVEELADYEVSAPPSSDHEHKQRVRIQRRMLLVAPQTLVAGMPADVHVGFGPPQDEQLLPQPADVVVRLSIVNGDPKRPQEEAFPLANEPEYCTFEVTPGLYKRVRLRVNVFQLGPNPDDIGVAGGMYVDLDVAPSAELASRQLAAYGADIKLTL